MKYAKVRLMLKYACGCLLLTLRGIFYVIAGICSFFFLFTSATKNSDSAASQPRTEHAPTLFSCTLIQTEAGYLFSYNSNTSSLNIYDETDTFVCSYRIPNEGLGTSEIHTCMGDVYIEQYRNNCIYRYGPRGEYLGCWDNSSIMDGGGLYDAHDTRVERYFAVEAGYAVVAFTEDMFYLKDRRSGEYFQLPYQGALESIAPLDLQRSDGGYYIVNTTLFSPDGAVVDSSPWIERFRSNKFSSWLYLGLGAVGGTFIGWATGKLERKGLVSTVPWKKLCGLYRERLLNLVSRLNPKSSH